METPRILLTTGGTGGHIFPALAVAEQIRISAPNAQILFVGSSFGPEKKLASEAGLEFIGLPVKGVLGRGLHSIQALGSMAYSIIKARKILAQFKPEVVVGFGAYASIPSLTAAKLEGIPIAIHEQNAVPGVSNRLMSRFAWRIFLSLPDKLNKFDTSKAFLVGNPVRSTISALSDTTHEHGSVPRLLVMGGSQGAKALNTAVIEAFRKLNGIFIHHQTGQADYERVRSAYAEAGIGADKALVEPFIADMASAYSSADLVLCRAGATTVAELAIAGKPSILIPFPYATHNHQTANARSMEAAGAARVVLEHSLYSFDLGSMISTLINDNVALDEMSSAAKRCAKPQAALDVARNVLELIR